MEGNNKPKPKIKRSMTVKPPSPNTGNPVLSLDKIKKNINNEHYFDNLDYAIGYEQCYNDILEILQNGVETYKEEPELTVSGKQRCMVG